MSDAVVLKAVKMGDGSLIFKLQDDTADGMTLHQSVKTAIGHLIAGTGMQLGGMTLTTKLYGKTVDPTRPDEPVEYITPVGRTCDASATFYTLAGSLRGRVKHGAEIHFMVDDLTRSGPRILDMEDVFAFMKSPDNNNLVLRSFLHHPEGLKSLS
ncbi:hypothetical protein pEaSNUABM54_00287 [Erwinia phage pEa_SNUABM_54]|nr:hypothetical protein pEaSNUABM54_00287 [Erwinia phage pEa_SNUABM_54]